MTIHSLINCSKILDILLNHFIYCVYSNDPLLHMKSVLYELMSFLNVWFYHNNLFLTTNHEFISLVFTFKNHTPQIHTIHNITNFLSILSSILSFSTSSNRMVKNQTVNLQSTWIKISFLTLQNKYFLSFKLLLDKQKQGHLWFYQPI